MVYSQIIIKDLLRRIKSKIIYRFFEKGRYKNSISFRAFDYYNCIFIHIPKAAGSAINKSLFNSIAAAHTPITHFEKIYSQNTFNRYFKFTFVRNPYDRIESAYNFLIQGGINKNDLQFADTHMKSYIDINDFVINYLNESSIFSYHHFKPQVWFLKDSSGKLAVDFIGKFENLHEDFNYIKNRLGIKSELNHFNKTKKGSYKKVFLNSEAKRKIARLYSEDFLKLDYEK